MKYTKIPENAFKELQLNAGVLLTDFDTKDGMTEQELLAVMIGATSGGVNFIATPTYEDYGADIDNAPVNVQYFLQIPLRSCETCGNDRAFPPKCAQKMQAVFAYSPRLCAMCAPRKEKGMVKSVNGQLWYCCPVCGQKLHKLSPDAVCNGVTTFCKKCKWEGVMVVKKGA